MKCSRLLVATVVHLAFTAKIFSQNDTVSKADIQFPSSLPGEAFLVNKIRDPVTGGIRIVSNSTKANSEKDLAGLEDKEFEAIRKERGKLDEWLSAKLTSKPGREEFDLIIVLATPAVDYLDKIRHSEKELKARSQSIQRILPVESIESITKKYGIGRFERINSRMFSCRLPRSKIESLKHHPSIASISETIPQVPLQANPPFTSLATSAYNPSASMPADAKGQGVNAATIEWGLTDDFVNCLGNLTTSQIDIYGNDSHSQQIFKALWNTASAANLWHRRSTTYIGTPAYHGVGDSIFILEKGIQTISLSWSRNRIDDSGCFQGSGNTIIAQVANFPEFIEMDEWAYMWPYPVFCSGTANWGYQYEANWQNYNGINVGNVQHIDQNHFAQSVGKKPCNQPGDDASQTRNPKNRYGGPTFRPVDSVYNYASGDRELPNLVVPGITPTYGIAMHDACLPPNSALPRTPLWSGTSYSAPVANGIAASIISSNSSLIGWPEKVRAIMIATSENVSDGDWNTNSGGLDGMDGAGVVSGANAVAFARELVTVYPGHTNSVTHGLHAGSIYSNEVFSSTINFKALVPNPKPSGKHFRAVLTWDSNPVRATNENRLTDLDLDVYYSGNIKGSYSWNGNVEVVDIPSVSLTAGATLDVKVNKVINRMPAGKSLYYSIAWTWVKDHAD